MTFRGLLIASLLLGAAVAEAREGQNFPVPTSKTAPPDELLNVWRRQIAPYTTSVVGAAKILDMQMKTGPNVRGKTAVAYLRFQPLGEDGTVESWNKANCAEPSRPLNADGVQVRVDWSEKQQKWVFGSTINSLACPDGPKLTQAEIDDHLTLVPPPTPPKIKAKDVTTPPPGSTERKAILDAIRAGFKAQSGAVQFKVKTLKMAAGFAYLAVMPQHKNGKPLGCAEGDDVLSEYWMKKVNGQWTVAVNAPCSGDPAIGLGESIGAPPQIVGKDAWPYFSADN